MKAAVRKVMLAAIALSCPTMLGAAAKADLVYEWVDDSNSGASGFLVISSNALKDGGFDYSDVVNFNFQAGFTYRAPFFALDPALVPISSVTGGFTSDNSRLFSTNAVSGLLTLDLTSDYGVINGQKWTRTNVSNGSLLDSGTGHWAISSVSAVPEPSTFALLGIGLVGAAARRWKAGRALPIATG